MCLVHLGYTSALAGDYERAAALLDKGVALFTELGETTWTQVAFRYQGLLALLDGRIDEAEPLLRTSLMKGREQAPQWEVAHWIEELAAVAAAKGETLRAAKLWGATDALFGKLGPGDSLRESPSPSFSNKASVAPQSFAARKVSPFAAATAASSSIQCATSHCGACSRPFIKLVRSKGSASSILPSRRASRP